MDQIEVSADVRLFMQEYFKAWTEGDVEKILSYYSEDVVINLFGVQALLEGKQAVKDKFVVPFTNGFPGNVHQMNTYIQSGNQVVIEWLFVAQHAGEFAGIPASGRQVQLPGCSIYTVENRYITGGKLFFNGPTLFAQIGAGQ